MLPRPRRVGRDWRLRVVWGAGAEVDFGITEYASKAVTAIDAYWSPFMVAERRRGYRSRFSVHSGDTHGIATAGAPQRYSRAGSRA